MPSVSNTLVHRFGHFLKQLWSSLLWVSSVVLSWLPRCLNRCKTFTFHGHFDSEEEVTRSRSGGCNGEDTLWVCLSWGWHSAPAFTIVSVIPCLSGDRTSRTASESNENDGISIFEVRGFWEGLMAISLTVIIF